MDTQVLNPEFLKFLTNFYRPDGKGTHDKTSGFCKCGEIHAPYDLQLLAVREFGVTKMKDPVGSESI